jgi:3-oxoacyl-[acyl-carrier protein] reductase
MKTLEERVAIVTGGADGVGRGIATVLAAEGARVAILDIDRSAAERAAAAIKGEVTGIGADVRSRPALDGAADQILQRWGRVDILAANAGIYPSRPIDEIDDEMFDRVLGVNLKGAINAIQACLPSMRERSYGRVVLTSSITGLLVGAPGYALYGSTKAALVGFMRSAALELAPHGITINSVNPGNVRTGGFENLEPGYQQQMLDAIPMRRLAEPEEVGWAVRFLGSEEAGYITGQTLVLDGGRVLPEGST